MDFPITKAEYVEGCARHYNNVAAMLADSELTKNTVCQTLGYYTPNDGGGGHCTYFDRAGLPDDRYLPCRALGSPYSE